MAATTINQVIAQLEQIVSDAKSQENTSGYFAALYLLVTKEVKKKVKEGFFDDNSRMEKLDVVFANRYLKAYTDFREGNAVTKSWKVAFEAESAWGLIVLQHLLVGMNAHINLDLGIAAAQITDKDSIESLHNDFNKINGILADLVQRVEEDLSEIWPTLLKILRIFSKIDSFLINFSMSIARDGAWKFANELAFRPPEISLEQMIAERDEKIAKLGSDIVSPGLLVKIIFWIIRIGERGSVSEKITILES